MITKLFKGTRAWIGTHSFVLAQDAEVDLEKIYSTDGVAEVLAGNVQNYGINIAALAHEEDGPLDEDGNPTRIHVSYGVGGARIETPVDEVVDVAAVQAANVAEADAAAKTAEVKTEPVAGETRVTTADVDDSIRIPDGEGDFQDPSKGNMRERLVNEMANAPRQFSSTGEITPGSENAFAPAVTTDLAAVEADSETDSSDDAPAQKGKLPADFPGQAKLAEAGITTFSRLRKVVDDLEAIEGIGPQTAAQIREALAKEA